MNIFSQRKSVFILLGCLVFSSFGAKSATLKIATLSPEGTAWMKMLRQAAANIETATRGEVKLKIYPGGVMGDDKAVLRKMRIGQLQGAALTSGGVMQPYPDIVLYNLPLTFRNRGEIEYVRQKMDAILMQGLREKKFVGFGIAEVGFAYPMTQTAVSSVGDFKNLKVWAPDNDPGAMRAYSTFDLTPIPLPISDVLTGLQTGLINAIGSPPVATIALQWHTQVTHLLDLPLLYVYGSFVLSEKAFAKLSPGHQKIVSKELSVAVQAVDMAAKKDNAAAGQALKSQGLVWLKPNASEEAEWYRLAEAANTRLIDQGYVSRGIFNEMMAHLADYRTGKSAD